MLYIPQLPLWKVPLTLLQRNLNARSRIYTAFMLPTTDKQMGYYTFTSQLRNIKTKINTARLRILYLCPFAIGQVPFMASNVIYLLQHHYGPPACCMSSRYSVKRRSKRPASVHHGFAVLLYFIVVCQFPSPEFR